MTEKEKRIKIEIQAETLDEARELASRALYSQPTVKPARKGSVFDPSFLLP